MQKLIWNVCGGDGMCYDNAETFLEKSFRTFKKLQKGHREIIGKKVAVLSTAAPLAHRINTNESQNERARLGLICVDAPFAFVFLICL